MGGQNDLILHKWLTLVLLLIAQVHVRLAEKKYPSCMLEFCASLAETGKIN